MNAVLFVDRDGVLIEDRHYIARAEDVVILPGVIEALAAFRRAGYALAVISNQSGIARGYFTESDLRAVNDRMTALFQEAGIRFDAIEYCPHLIDGTEPAYRCDCTCRKPKPGMILRAAEQLNADVRKSIMIGDKISDVQTGLNAGCGTSVLIDPETERLTACIDPQQNRYYRAPSLRDCTALISTHISKKENPA